jgi:uncharacterized membrane protein
MSDPPESLQMRWLLKRNCSASPHQLALVFASVVAVSFLFGAVFALHGLWLVLPFVGLELLAVALAFVCYGRHAADFERIELGAHGLTVERAEGGRRSCWTLAPRWTRVEVERSGRGWMGRVRLHLAAGGERVEVGRHLPDERRLRLAQELRHALAAAPGGI